MQQGQLTVTFIVVERPQVDSVEFVGNVKFSDKELLRDLDLRAGEPLSGFGVRQRIDEIEQRYRDAGYSDVRVTVDESLLQEQRRIVFVIEEGPRIRLREIVFEGNHSMPEDELKRQTTTSTYVPLFRTGAFDVDGAERDAAALQTFYRDRGYLDARTSYRSENVGPSEDLRLVFVIEEGRPVCRWGDPLRGQQRLQR